MSLVDKWRSRAVGVTLATATAFVSGCDMPAITEGQGTAMGAALGAGAAAVLVDGAELTGGARAAVIGAAGVFGGATGGAIAANRGHCDQRTTSTRDPRTGVVTAARTTDDCRTRNGYPEGVPALGF